MPKIGAETERRRALIHAAIELIGARGSLDVPVKLIAERAGMSSALAFHYFGGKDEIIVETMRFLLRELSQTVVRELSEADNAYERLDGIIKASFASEQFDRKTIAAWLVFYLKAYSYQPASRLLSVYVRRLNSNLVAELSDLLTEKMEKYQARREAFIIAESLGALIDGLYIRQALGAGNPDSDHAIALCRAHLKAALSLQGMEFNSLKVKGNH